MHEFLRLWPWFGAGVQPDGPPQTWSWDDREAVDPIPAAKTAPAGGRGSTADAIGARFERA